MMQPNHASWCSQEDGMHTAKPSAARADKTYQHHARCHSCNISTRLPDPCPHSTAALPEIGCRLRAAAQVAKIDDEMVLPPAYLHLLLCLDSPMASNIDCARTTHYTHAMERLRVGSSQIHPGRHQCLLELQHWSAARMLCPHAWHRTNCQI